MNEKSKNKGFLKVLVWLVISFFSLQPSSLLFAAAPVARITITGPQPSRISVTNGNPVGIVVSRPATAIANIVTPGQQGARGADGQPGAGVPIGGTDGQVLTKSGTTDYAAAWQDASGGVSSWNDLPDKPNITALSETAIAVPDLSVTGTLYPSGRITGGVDNFNAILTMFELNGQYGNFGTVTTELLAVPLTGDVRSIASIFAKIDSIPPAQVSADWNSVASPTQILNKPTIPAAQVNSDWSASGTVAEILNKPAFTRGYDGREIELQTSATHVQWRYLTDPPATWINLVPLSAISGTNGTDGTNGVDGRTVLSGSGAPSNGSGADGDFYIDTANAHLYGPKAAGAWSGTYIELVGPQGPAGPEGPPGALPNQAAIFGVIDDPIDGSTMWLQQGDTEQATNAKDGVKDRLGNAKTWRDGNGTIVRQCITGDTAPAFKMLAPDGVTVLYSVACDNTMTFTGTMVIK